jgi:hypothetical protein
LKGVAVICRAAWDEWATLWGIFPSGGSEQLVWSWLVSVTVLTMLCGGLLYILLRIFPFKFSMTFSRFVFVKGVFLKNNFVLNKHAEHTCGLL